MATNLDLTLVKSYNLSTINIADISTYDTTPANVSFQITPPQGFNIINVGFTPRAVNIYSAADLDISDDEGAILPDGIYTIVYSVFPNTTNTVTKTFMRVENIKCKYERVFLMVDISCECNTTYKNKLKNKLREIRFLIEGSIASANAGDITNSNEMYIKANCMLDDIKSCNC